MTKFVRNVYSEFMSVVMYIALLNIIAVRLEFRVIHLFDAVCTVHHPTICI